MATNTAGVQIRQDPRQVANTLKKTVNFNDLGIASGLAFEEYLPIGAFILSVLVDVVTAFNAGTTNILTVGSNATTYNNLINSTDVNEAVAGVYDVTRGLGRSITATAVQNMFAKYTQTGAAATTGQAIIIIVYDGGFAT